MILALALALALQDPTTTPEAPPTTAPTTTTETPPTPPPPAPTEELREAQAPNPPPGFPEPSPAERGVIVPPPPTAPTTTTTATTTKVSEKHGPEDLTHYVTFYGAEYASIAVVAGLYATGLHKQITPSLSLIGPQFDLDKPNLDVLLDPRLDDVIGRPLLKEKVPESAVAVSAAVVLLSTAGIDYLAEGDLHRTHGLVLGGAEAIVSTLVVTEALKLSVGRLRPDFRERYVRAACGGATKAAAGLDCSAVDDGVSVSKDELIDGMKSFPSGHSSASFATATFASLWIGSTLVWNEDRPAWGPAVGALSMGALYAGAAGVAATRISDNRHHPEDVVVGSAIGATLGATAFLVHFDLDGHARRRSFDVVPQTAMGSTGTGNGLAVVGSF